MTSNSENLIPPRAHVRRLRYALLISAAALTLGGRADAQSSTTGNADASLASHIGEGVRTPFEGIALTDAQRAALRLATERTRAARAAILRRQPQRGRLSTEDRDALAKLAEAHNAAIENALSAAQRDQLTANVQAERQRRRREQQASGSHPSAPTVPTP